MENKIDEKQKSYGRINILSSERFTLFIFLSPAIILLVLFVIYPFFYTIAMSFLGESGEFVGLKNYQELINDPNIVNLERFPSTYPPWGALIHNIVWIAIHLPLTIGLGLLFAVTLKDVKGGAIIKSMIFLGMVMPMIVGGLMALFIFDKDIGIFNMLLRIIGLRSLADKTWTMYPQTSLLATILTGIWMWTGFSMIVYSSALATIPRELYEAAEVDGANSIQKFIYITLPQLKPATMVIVVMSVLYELKIFDIVYIATHGGPGGSSMVLALLIYIYGFIAFKFNKAAALATLLTLLTLIPAIWVAKTSISTRGK